MGIHIRKIDQTEGGFTLIELLVVVLILGVLAAIAVPAFLNQRKVAYEASMKSDVKNAATQIQTEFMKTGTYPSNTSGLTVSDGNTLRVKDEMITAIPFDVYRVPKTVPYRTSPMSVMFPDGRIERHEHR